MTGFVLTAAAISRSEVGRCCRSMSSAPNSVFAEDAEVEDAGVGLRVYVTIAECERRVCAMPLPFAGDDDASMLRARLG